MPQNEALRTRDAGTHVMAGNLHRVVGHDKVEQRFRQILLRDRLASSFLFVGPAGIGKRHFAMRLAAALLCETRDPKLLDPCGQCPSCRQVAAGTHPDLLLVSKPADKSELPLELFAGPRERRNEEGLCHDISLRPMRGNRKVAIIDDADWMSEEAANCLLKTLEEPPPGSVLILIGTSPERQLPTIRSRCQVLRFQPLSAEEASQLIVENLGISDPVEARRLAVHAGGSLQRSSQLSDQQLWPFRQSLLAALAELPAGSVPLAMRTVAFVEEVGKEAIPRRARLRLVIEFAADIYRELVRRQAGLPAGTDGGDDATSRAVESVLMRGIPHGIEPAAECLDRCLEALAHVDRNVHLATLVESWIDDLAQLSAGAVLPRTAQ